MDPHGEQEFDNSPKDIDYSKMTEAEREAQFRRKRQEYVAEKMSRKKQLMRAKKQQFGSSSSDSSDEEGPGSRSSKSSTKKTEPKQLEQRPPSIEVTPKKIGGQLKQQQVTPVKKMSESLQRISVNVPSKKGNQWVKDVLVIGEKTIIIQNVTQQIKNFNKIKIISQNILGCPFKIKINSSNDQQIIFAVGTTQDKLGLPPSYYVFAKLIQQKLILNGIKLKQNQQQKISGIPQSLISGSLIYGKICKKSQVLGNWQQRYLVIKKQGIFSYKKFTQKHSMFIPQGSINQLWTRLQIQDNLLIIKIWYSGKKTQFGFPLNDYLSINSWLYNFYSMMARGK